MSTRSRKSKKPKSWANPAFLMRAELPKQFCYQEGKGHIVLIPTTPSPHRRGVKRHTRSLLKTNPAGLKTPPGEYYGHHIPINTVTTHNKQKLCESVAMGNHSCSRRRGSTKIRTSTDLKRSRDLENSNFFKKIYCDRKNRDRKNRDQKNCD